MDPLRDREKRRVAFDHEPARVDAGPADVGEQRLQHLGNPAAGCGRVDVQDCALTERAARRLGHRLEPPHTLNPDQRLKARSVERLHRNLVQPRARVSAHRRPRCRAQSNGVVPTARFHLTHTFHVTCISNRGPSWRLVPQNESGASLIRSAGKPRSEHLLRKRPHCERCARGCTRLQTTAQRRRTNSTGQPSRLKELYHDE